MKFCKLCIQADTRPNISFNEDGICPACSHYISGNRINDLLANKKVISVRFR